MKFAPYQYVQVLGLVLSLVYYRDLKRHLLGLFLPLLLLINAIEIIGNNYKLLGWSNNYSIYNLYLLLSTPLWLILYRNLLWLGGAARNVFHGILVLTTVLLLLNLFLLQGPRQFNTYSLILAMILFIVFSSLALLRLSFREDLSVSLYRHPYFWINAGNLLFSLVTLVFLGLQQYILENRIVIRNKTLYEAVMPVANGLLYLGFSYAFYLCHRLTKIK